MGQQQVLPAACSLAVSPRRRVLSLAILASLCSVESFLDDSPDRLSVSSEFLYLGRVPPVAWFFFSDLHLGPPEPVPASSPGTVHHR